VSDRAILNEFRVFMMSVSNSTGGELLPASKLEDDRLKRETGPASEMYGRKWAYMMSWPLIIGVSP
jgi:hypothetical protein